MTKQDKAVQDLINKMFELAGHEVTYDDIKAREDAWYTDWTMTVAQHDEWIEWELHTYAKSSGQEKKHPRNRCLGLH